MTTATEQRRQQVLLGHLRPQSTQTAQANDISHHSFNNTDVDQLLLPSVTSSEQPEQRVSYSVVCHEPSSVHVAVLTLHSAPVNALSDEMMDAIRAQLERAWSDSSVKAIVLCSSIPGFFVAGADIAQIMKKQQKGGGADSKDENFAKFLHLNNGLMNKIEAGPKPTVAAIHGVALGGGLELAMACNARVCSPESRLGLPELNLGIIPGFGGTQRLPRLIGVQKALEMMISSVPIPGKVAEQLKLVDKLVDGASVLQTAIDLASQIALFKYKRTRALHINNRLESPDKLKFILDKAEADAKKLYSQLPHVQACINAVKAGLEFNGEVGLDTEGAEFLRVCDGPVSKGMIHFFFAERATGKVPSMGNVTGKKISKLGIIGGGTMGSGIAIAALSAGIEVTLKEINDQALQAGVKRVMDVLDGRLQRKKLSQQQYDKMTRLFKAQTSYDGFKELDMVIEAVLEIVPLKQKIFQEMEQQCNKDCILASNTSTIDLNQIGASVQSKDRIIGLHFFSPAHVMPLLEIIRTDKTAASTIATSLNFAKQIRKTPVVVGNCPGFLVNRTFYPYGEAAHYLVDRGVDLYQIDKAMQKFGFRVGPFLMNDIAGVDVINFAFKSMSEPFKNRTYPVYLNQLLVEAKRLGQKTGSGNYKFDSNTGRPTPDPEIRKFIEQARKMSGNPPLISGLSDQQIVEYLLFPTVNEALRVVEEGHVYRVSDVDVACTMGMNFPRHYGGLIKWADTVGAKYIAETLDRLAKESGQKMFEPCNYLRQCANSGASLYSIDKKLMSK